MIELNTRYTISIFGNFPDINMSPESLTKLVAIFGPAGYIPNATYEFTAPTIQPIPRPSFIMNQKGLSFVAFSGKIDFNFMFNGTEEIEFDDFIQEAKKYFEQIINEFKLVSNRLAFNSESILQENFSKSATKSFESPVQYYKQNEPIEWNQKYVARDHWIESEPVNIISDYRFNEINIQSDIYKIIGSRLILVFDINTFQGNLGSRFYFEDLNKFIEFAIVKKIELTEQLSGMLLPK